MPSLRDSGSQSVPVVVVSWRSVLPLRWDSYFLAGGVHAGDLPVCSVAVLESISP